MRNLFLFLSMAGLALLAACNNPAAPDFIKSSGRTIRVARPELAGIRSVTLRDNIALEIRGDILFPILEVPANLEPNIRLHLADSTLLVENHSRFNWLRAYKPVRLLLPARHLREVVQEGYGPVTCLDTLRAVQIRLALYGNTSAELLVRADALALDVNGQGELTVAGRSRYTYLALRKYASLNGQAFTTRLADIEQAGAGNATLAVQDSLTIRQRGPGCLHLASRPVVRAQQADAPCIRYE